MSWLSCVALGFIILIVSVGLYVVFSLKTADEYLKSECKKRLKNQLPAFTNDDWGMVLGAPYAAFNGYPCNEYSTNSTKDDGLKSAWGIGSRQELIFQLYFLLEGGHTKDYYGMKDDLSSASKDQFNAIVENIKHSDLDNAEKKEMIWQCTMMFNNQNNIQHVEYLAWDYVRFSMLCLKGCRLKYITEEEAKTWTLMLAPRLREIYNGWDDLWKSFIITRWFWSAKELKWTMSQDMYANVINMLLQEKGSPTAYVAWDAPLPVVDMSSFNKVAVEQGCSIGIYPINK